MTDLPKNIPAATTRLLLLFFLILNYAIEIMFYYCDYYKLCYYYYHYYFYHHIYYILRSKVNKNKIDIITSSDNDIELSRNFWSYVKNVFVKSKEILPSFNNNVCTEYFKKTFKCINPTKMFTIPSWIP